MGKLRIRPLRWTDIGTVMGIQSSAYKESFWEPSSTFESILTEYPQGCWLAEVDGGPAGYLFSQPEDLTSPPSLGSVHTMTPEPTCFYIHDTAVDPRFQGQGVGEALTYQALRCSDEEGLGTLALIAVQESQSFWARFGFAEPAQISPAIAARLATYGPSARFMIFNR